MGRSPCCDENGIKKGPWTPEEDELLVDYIKANGHGSWRAFPKLAGLNRCGKSCRLRWNNYLRPDIKRGKFTEEEDELIIRLHSVLGNKWSQIATHLSGRTDNEIKNHWNTHLRKKLLQLGIDPITHAQRTDFNFLANLPQLFAMENVASSLNPWDNALRVQADATTQLAKLQVLHNLLQVINGFSPTPNLDFIHLPRSNQIPDNSFLNQYVRSNSQFDPGNITLVPGQNPNHVPNSKFYCPNSSNCEFHSISNTGFDDQIPSLSFMNDTTAATTKNNINSPHTFANANTIPNLVSASPENSGANQTENDEISPTDTSKNLSTSTTTFEPWGDFNIDDDTNDHYWKYFIE